MQKRTKIYIVFSAFVFMLFLSLFGIPLLFSVATGVPYWFLAPSLRAFSLEPSPRSMSVEVNPVVPTTLGQTITVTVKDSQSGSALEGVSIKAVRDGLNIDKTTNSSGVATFEYMGAITVIYASKEDYFNSDPTVIPRIPDEWVTTRNYLYISWVIETLSLIVAIVGLLMNVHVSAHKKKKGVLSRLPQANAHIIPVGVCYSPVKRDRVR